ncbi:MAG: ErfK/YbiS/YcfS/YnhG family protein [Bacteroidetes bacterium]|nr:ErfK/YbiS/YcfS/YnhG family protein [Bacteroidota bacterium]
MRIKKFWKRIIILAVILALVPVIIIMLIRLVPQPPQEEVEDARIALSEAASNNADTYTKKLYREAKSFYDSAMIKWQEENKRFIYFRNYEEVVRLADLSARKARQAAKISRNSEVDLNIFLKQKIENLNNIVGQIDKIFTSYPLSAEVWNRISRGKMLLKESEVAYRKGQYAQSKVKVADSELLLTDSYEKAKTNLKEYFNSYPVWKNWVDRTIRESRQNQNYSIIIDKKFGSNKTKYHKALLINYPNETDREEFKKEIAKGTLPRSAKIGSLIEIHGDGGRGVDWTEGCIALTDSEMDVVYKIAMEGTPVTIVGSIVNIDQILD